MFSPPDSPQSHGRFLVGLELSDGRRGYHGLTESAGEFAMIVKGGGGSDYSFAANFRVNAIPSPGPMTLYLDWRTGGIRDQSIQIDTVEIIAAATRAQPLWL